MARTESCNTLRTAYDLALRLLTGICFWTGLTPELSRADLRPWRWFNHSASAEAAKRARLERIVRPVPAVLLAKQLIAPEPTTDNCSSCERQTQKRSAGVLAGTEFVAMSKRQEKTSLFAAPVYQVTGKGSLAEP